MSVHLEIRRIDFIFARRLAFVVGLGLLSFGCGQRPPAPPPSNNPCSSEIKELSEILLHEDVSRRYSALNKLREYDAQTPPLDVSNVVGTVVSLLADGAVANWLPRITIGEEAASVLCQLQNEDAGNLAYPLLVSLTTNDNPLVRANAAQAFHVKDRATRARPHLLLLSKDRDGKVAKAAQKALQSFSVSDLPESGPNSSYHYSEHDKSWHVVDPEGRDSILKKD